MRRLKSDKSIIADLPDKTEIKAFCPLARKQAALYQAAVAELEERLKQSADGIARRRLVLSFLMRLKQTCNHPTQWLGNGSYDEEDSGKFPSSPIGSRQEKLLVFTQFKEIIPPVEKPLGAAFRRPGLVLHGETPVAKRKELVKKFQEDERMPSSCCRSRLAGPGSISRALRMSCILIDGGIRRSRTRRPIGPIASGKSATFSCTSSFVEARSRVELTS
jgi:SNF2 family DNA or RNA helicase